MADDKTLPTLRILPEYAMVNPPRLLGYHVYKGPHIVGVIPLDEMPTTPAPMADERNPVAWAVTSASGFIVMMRRTKDEADANLGYNTEYRVVPLYATPPAPRVTEAMVETGARALLSSVHPEAWEATTDRVRNAFLSDARRILTAALRGTEG